MNDSRDDEQIRQAEVINPYDEAGVLPQGPPQKSGSWIPACLIGCGLISLVMVIGCAVSIYLLASRLPGKAAELVRDGLAENIRSSDLPVDEQDAIVAEMDRVVVAFQAGEVGMDDIQRTLEEVAESPLVAFILIAGLEEGYLQHSGLSDEEKMSAKLTIQRLHRGIIEEKIDMGQLEPAFDHIATKTGDGEWKLKEKLSDEELRAFLAECKQLADDAQVPNEPFEFVISDEVRKIVDTLLGIPTEDDKPSADMSSPGPPAEVDGAEFDKSEPVTTF